MKILMFDVRPDEEKIIHKDYQNGPNQVDTTNETLTMKNVDKLKNYDAISLHMIDSDPKIYAKLAQLGIKQISIRHTGYEFINMKAAHQNHLVVTNVPGYSPRSVSEMVLMHVMMLVRHFKKVSRREAKGNFLWDGVQAKELYNLTVGIIGAGRIGSATARIFKALGCKVLANDPFHRASLEATVKYVDKPTLLKKSDIITMHTPLFKTTYHLIGKDEFKIMRNDAIFINASRGAVVDTQALIDALKHQEIAGAGLDTIEDENPIFNHQLSKMPTSNQYYNQLQAMDNVNITPHIGFNTDVSTRNMVKISIDSAIKAANGEQVKTEVK